MNKAECIMRVQKHNEMISIYNMKIAPQLMREAGIEVAEDGTIPADQFIKAMHFSSGRMFYDMAKEECSALRSEGFDVKINMQTAELVF